MANSALDSNKDDERRRSGRVIVPVPVLVVGQGTNGHAFEEETFTLRINSAGGSLALAASIRMGQRIKITHRKTNFTAECKVVYLGPQREKKLEVGFEFVESPQNFWGE